MVEVPPGVSLKTRMYNGSSAMPRLVQVLYKVFLYFSSILVAFFLRDNVSSTHIPIIYIYV